MDNNYDNKSAIENDFKGVANLLKNIYNDVKDNKSKDDILSQISFAMSNISYLNKKVQQEMENSNSSCPAPALTNNGIVKIETITTEDGKYIGEIKNGVPNGRGKLYYTGHLEGDFYEGDFKNGDPDGKGKYYHRNGNIYEGDFVKDKADGKGIFYSNNGNRYEGEFKADNREGKGIYYFANGDRTMGDYHNNKPVGIHVTLHSDGRVSQKIYN